MTKGEWAMVKLTEEMKDFIKRIHVGYVATSDKNGRPNVAPKAISILDDETLLYPEVYHYVKRTRTLRNMEENPNVAIAIIETLGRGNARGYQFKGRAQIHYSGKVYDKLLEGLKGAPHMLAGPGGGRLIAAVTIQVENIYSHRPKEAGKRLA
jgi:predicted pyridoxine 5'-phosphate oxidase superfamily flavin-nucleotide-binding protein